MLDSLVAPVTFRGTWTIEGKKRCLASLSVVEIRDIFCFAASEASYERCSVKIIIFSIFVIKSNSIVLTSLL